MSDDSSRFLTSVFDSLHEGIIVVDRSRKIVLCNRQARILLGLDSPKGPGHPAGRCADGDVSIVCDTCLGADDGKLMPGDLEIIGVRNGVLRSGDPFVAIGRVGGEPGSAEVLVGQHSSGKPLALTCSMTDSSGRKHLIAADVRLGEKRAFIEVDGQRFDYVYKVSVGHMVALDPKDFSTKFYQAPGYSARGEHLGHILRGGLFSAKEPGKSQIGIMGNKLEQVCTEGLSIEDLNMIFSGRRGAIVPHTRLVNGVPLKFSVVPVVSDANVDGAAIILEDAGVQDHWPSDVPLVSFQGRARTGARASIGSSPFARIQGGSEAIRQCVIMADKMASLRGNILIIGESGTGKNLFARAIHEASPRRDGPFVVLNCAAIPQNLVESELFGYAPGSFTGALRTGRKGRFRESDGGTLFLDEISDLDLVCQAKLLHAIEDGTIQPIGSVARERVDVRIIAATNRDLWTLVEEGAFRADLYYRLNVFCLEIPPLRERKQDIIDLAESALTVLSAVCGRRCSISDDTYRMLLEFPWPGNVRQLQNILERAVALGNSDVIEPGSLPREITQYKAGLELSEPDAGAGDPSLSFHRTLRLAEEGIIMKALDECGGNRSKAAKYLGISRSTLYKKMSDRTRHTVR